MKIAATSDLHGYLPEIKEADILTISGDIVPLNIQKNLQASREWLATTFINWCNNQPVKWVLLIPGNHDWVFYQDDSVNSLFIGTKIRNIHMKEEVIGDLHFFGCSWCKQFYNWAYMLPNEDLVEEYNKIPENIDVLLTHDSPAIGLIGIITQGKQMNVHAGNVYLAEAIKRKRPRYTFCGHIHSSSHIPEHVNGSTIVNVSLLDEHYSAVYYVHYYDI